MRVVFRGRLRKALGRPSRPGRPDIGLPETEEPVDPDYGLEDGELPEVGVPEFPDQPLPPAPPGIWPPLSPGHPTQPLPPGGPNWPPGAIWPPANRPSLPSVPGAPPKPTPPMVSQKMFVLAWIPGVGFKYIVVDPALNPPLPEWPQEPPAQPK